VDNAQVRKATWDKSTERKRRRAEANTDKCLQGRELTRCDNIWNYAYRRGMAGPQVDGLLEDEESTPTVRKQSANSICVSCDKKGHKTSKSKLCPFSLVLISPVYRPENIERSTGKVPVHFVPWILVTKL
jgi:hypothetical protein